MSTFFNINTVWIHNQKLLIYRAFYGCRTVVISIDEEKPNRSDVISQAHGWSRVENVYFDVLIVCHWGGGKGGGEEHQNKPPKVRKSDPMNLLYSTRESRSQLSQRFSVEHIQALLMALANQLTLVTLLHTVYKSEGCEWFSGQLGEGWLILELSCNNNYIMVFSKAEQIQINRHVNMRNTC